MIDPLLFLGLFVLLEWLYQTAAPSWVEHTLIDGLTVRPGAALIAWLMPGEGIHAMGHQLISPHARLSVLNGCEGTEVALMLAAAMMAFGAGWRHRLLGIVLGCAFVYALNILRIVALYYYARFDPAWFGALHGYVAPTIVVAAAALFFVYWMLHGERPSHVS